MKLDIKTTGIYIIPETPQDQVYISFFMQLKEDGDSIKLVRRDDSNTAECAYLEAFHGEPNEAEDNEKR